MRGVGDPEFGEGFYPTWLKFMGGTSGGRYVGRRRFLLVRRSIGKRNFEKFRINLTSGSGEKNRSLGRGVRFEFGWVGRAMEVRALLRLRERGDLSLQKAQRLANWADPCW